MKYEKHRYNIDTDIIYTDKVYRLNIWASQFYEICINNIKHLLIHQ